MIDGIAMGIWEAILGVGMPWKMAIILAGGGPVACGVAMLSLRVALLPEFFVTARLRRWGLRPLPGTHVFGLAVLWSTKALGVLLVLVIVVAALGIAAWFARSVMPSSLGAVVDLYFEWWSSIGTQPVP